MKPNFDHHSGSDNIENKLNRILSRINLDNFKYRIMNGTTDPTADTQRLFRHGMTPRPWIALPLIGDVYIGSEISNTEVDVRSTQSSMDFRILLLG